MRPQRNKKPVSYAQLEDSDSDGDFVSAIAPLNKKSRTDPKELKRERTKPKLKNLEKEDFTLQEKTPQKRMALDDKLYQRDLQVALALSVKETPQVITDGPEPQGQSIEKCGEDETETVTKFPHMSNCSVASDYLDLDKITEEENSHDRQGRRKAASKAVVQQRKVLLEDSDGDNVDSSEPDFETSQDSEDDSDFDASEDDENFTVRKSKVKGIKRKEVKVKPPEEKKDKKPKSKCSTSVTSVDSVPAVKSEFQPSPKKVSPPSNTIRKPLQIRSPPAESKRPKWVPPAASGSCSSTSRSPLPAVSVKSPSHSLRLGLSRLARVKPLHPTAATS
ncbi:RAD51-associated protein 1 [Rhynchocyon petersi]